jgi:GT2 family glycosyltransferase
VLSARGGADVGRSLPVGPCDFLTYAPSSHLLLSTRRFRDLGGWDESLEHCEDVDLSWRAQLAGHRVVHTPDSTLHYRLRGSTGDLFRQVRAYKTAEVGLYVRFRQSGARRPRARETAHWWWWIVSRSPYVVLDTRRRYLWWAAAGCAAGRVRGSLRHRVVYL